MKNPQSPTDTVNGPEATSLVAGRRWRRILVVGGALLLTLSFAVGIFLAYGQVGLVFDVFSLRYCG